MFIRKEMNKEVRANEMEEAKAAECVKQLSKNEEMLKRMSNCKGFSIFSSYYPSQYENRVPSALCFYFVM